MTRRFLTLAVLFAVALIPGRLELLAADIVDTAVAAGNFNTLVAAVKAADLVDTLKGDGPFTVFAPTDDAFAKIPSGTLQHLLEPEARNQLTSILTYHVVPGRVAAKAAFQVDEAPTVNGQQIQIGRRGGRLTVDDASVVVTDINCSNGVIHVIDTVLMPESRTIPEVAAEAGSFATLLKAVTSAELAETLSSEGPFTVFAPTDDAFAALPAGTVDSLLKPENRKRLVDILTYHVVPGRLFAAAAIEAESAKTLQGKPVMVKVTGDGVRINDAGLVKADIQAANGVIHVIDRVLIPKALSVSEARELLERTVSQGARAFNRGDVQKCCSLYEQACQHIVESGAELPESVRAVLSASLHRAGKIHHKGERAWVLRHGIDLAYHTLDD